MQIRIRDLSSLISYFYYRSYSADIMQNWKPGTAIVRVRVHICYFHFSLFSSPIFRTKKQPNTVSLKVLAPPFIKSNNCLSNSFHSRPSKVRMKVLCQLTSEVITLGFASLTFSSRVVGKVLLAKLK